MATLDWILVGAYFLLTFLIAAYYSRRAGRNTSEFFLSGRSLPWWLAGTSMVATTFAADTPLAVTELVADNGIAGNWLWWSFAFGGMCTVNFFARLWRRSGIQTDVEFVELRYAGKPAAWLRGIKAVYFGLVMNVIIIGWVSLAMETVIQVLFPDLALFGRSSFAALGLEISAALVLVSALVVLVSGYALLAGLWGVAVTDAFQFLLAMGGSILMAILVLQHPDVGGITGLKAQLPAHTFNFLPTIGKTAGAAAAMTLTIPAFVAFIGIQWWSSWYPGAEPGGGGYIAQRMMSAKDERHALFATLGYTIAHYCVRPWPWIIVALASLVLYPDLSNSREGFVMVMRDVLPSGLLGLVVAAFLAAFMSTVSTQLNWGVSYLVHDGWRRFVARGRSERYYVALSRILTFVLGLVSIVVATRLASISGAWELILTASAGLGMVLIFRWYWWRINAWSELAATLTPIILVVLEVAGVRVPGLGASFPTNLFTVVGVSTAAWLSVTFLTSPTPRVVLDKFYRRVRPAGPGWRPLAAAHQDIVPKTGIVVLSRRWITGVILVYTMLFAVGHVILGNIGAAAWLIPVAVVASAILWWDLSTGGNAAPAS